MLHIYLTRHGETEWNIENRLQGWKDSPLTTKGINDALLLSKKITEIDFNAIYTSPSERAVKTALILKGDKDIPIIEDSNLKEINFGVWEGKTKAEINERFENEFSSLWETPHLYNHLPQKGESIAELRTRAENAMKTIFETNRDGNILIVTHAVVLATIVAYFKKSPIEKLWDLPFVHGTSLTQIVGDQNNQSYTFQLLCDMSHLS